MDNVLDLFKSMKEDYNRVNMKLLVNREALPEEEINIIREKCQRLNQMSTKFNFAVDGSSSELLRSISDLDKECLLM